MPLSMAITIKSHHPILPTIDPRLFSWVFDEKFSPRYYAWRDGRATYQLRVIGGPGSGKTTLVSLLAQDILLASTSVPSHQGDAHLPRKLEAVVSIFLDLPSPPPSQLADSNRNEGRHESAKTFISRFRNEILGQLCRQLGNSTAPGSSGSDNNSGSENLGEQRQHSDRIQQHRNSDNDRIQHGHGHECELETKRETVLTTANKFETITLLVDGIDILWPTHDVYLALEAELAAFSNAGWRVMASSRVLHPFRVTGVECDAGIGVAGHEPMDAHRGIWWECEKCLGEQYYICEVCKEEGRGCKNLEHSTHHLAIQPSRSAATQPAVLEISLHNHPAVHFRDFITTQLQEEHGDLHLPYLPHSSQLSSSQSSSPQEERQLPPLSPLGHSLVSTSRTSELLNYLVTKSSGNPFLLLARLEYIRDTKSAGEALMTGDRLPANLITPFTAGVDRIIHSLSSTSTSREEGLLNLALDALIVVAETDAAQGMEWEELQEVLEDLGYGYEHVTEERVLFATAGFLKCYPLAGTVWIKCFCEDFALFVAQDYHAFLAERAKVLKEAEDEEEEEEDE